MGGIVYWYKRVKRSRNLSSKPVELESLLVVRCVGKSCGVGLSHRIEEKVWGVGVGFGVGKVGESACWRARASSRSFEGFSRSDIGGC